MSGALERFDAEARRTFSRYGSTVVRRGYLFRHPVYTRVLHWTVTIFFIASLLSGFAVYSPWLFHWLTPVFGGGPTTRFLHPWFGLLFDIFFLFQFVNWVAPMAWSNADSRFLRPLKGSASKKDNIEPNEKPVF